MKTKLAKRFSKFIAVLAFLSVLAGNAFAFDNTNRVVSPYWQSDSTSYTFIAVSHTSLSGMASQIGLTINAITNDQSAFASALTFTITSGTTTRVFIVRTNQSAINSTSISSAKFIVGPSADFEHGHLRIDPIATDVNARTGKISLTGDGYRDITMLSFWGAVVLESNTTGFAMEFIGDMADSQASRILQAGSTVETTREGAAGAATLNAGTVKGAVAVVGPAAP